MGHPLVTFKRESGKLQQRFRREVLAAVSDFEMISPGDRVMVCLSGGKDSYTLLHLLQNLIQSGDLVIELLAFHLDQKQPDYPVGVMRQYLESLQMEFHIVEQDTYSTVTRVIPEGKTMCSLCSRLRRGVIYRYAEELQVDKIALGHHRDDILETFFLNMFFGGKLKAMAPKLISDDGKHTVIRPLSYIREKDIERFTSYQSFPIIPCNLCGSQDNLQRAAMKEMLRTWDRSFPGRLETIFTSLQNLVPEHLLDKRNSKEQA